MVEFSSEYLERFETVNEVMSMEGFTPALLANLHDVVRKFGTVDEDNDVVQLETAFPVEMYVSVSLHSENYSILVVGSGAEMSDKSDFIQIEKDPLKEDQSVVYLDDKLTVEDVNSFIETIDELMMGRGFIEKKTGERLYSNGLEDESFVVEDFFFEPGTIMVLDDEIDPEVVRQQFDDPKSVVILRGYAENVCLCHLRDYLYLLQRLAIIKSVLRSKNIFSMDAVEFLPDEEIDALNDEVDRRSAN